MIPLSEFPAIDATLNGTSALLLALGYFFIRRKKIQAHKVCMLSGFAASSLFLVCCIWYHAHHGVTQGGNSRLALGMFFVLELLVTLDSAVRHRPGPRRILPL